MRYAKLLLVIILTVPSIAISEIIPHNAYAYKRILIKNVQSVWGLDGPIALTAAQIHQESAWRENAQSPYAHGLAQFTHDTADWIVKVYPELGPPAPYSPKWALMAVVRYDKHIFERQRAYVRESLSICTKWAFALSGYNGGPGWVNRDRKLAQASGKSPDRWWGHVSEHTSRASWANKENRHYVDRIIVELQPRYYKAGWDTKMICLRGN